MKLIPLNRGMFAIVDNDDFERLNQFKWITYKQKGRENWYVIRSNKKNGLTPKQCHMSHHILTAPEGYVIDHINGNSLDNRRENLRIATYQQNSRNRTKRKATASKYKGLCRVRNKWRVSIAYDKRRIFLGYFEEQITAAKVYDKYAVLFFGKFANLNFPNENTV